MRYLLFLVGLLFFAGCANKSIHIKAPVGAEVDSFAKKRKIAVLPFKEDKINFRGRLEAALANVRINNKPYFEVVKRDKIGEVLKELRFQASDLVGNKVAKFGKLVGAEVLISGRVKSYVSKGAYKSPRMVCSFYDKKGRCLRYKTIYVTCRTSEAALNVSIDAIDVSTARVIDAYSVTKKYKGDSCKGNYKSPYEVLNNLADEVVREYVKRVAPHYVSFRVELIEDVDSVDLSSKDEKLFKRALKYIEHNRLDRAEMLLKMLNEKVRGKSYEILYDLGVVLEAQGKFKEALAAYKMADKVLFERGKEPNELVDRALMRVKALLKEQSKLKELEK